MNHSLAVYDLDYFKRDVIERFFPRRLIVSREDEVINNCVRKSLQELNDYLFQWRLYEFGVIGSTIDLSELDADMPGIYVKRIMQIIPAAGFESTFSTWRRFYGAKIVPINLLRSQSDFIEFILSSELYRQLKKRYANREVDYYLAGNKILLGPSFGGVTRCVVLFLPGLKYDRQSSAWELYDLEEKFVTDYLEALVSYREGRAQSEMEIMELSTNADDLMSEGKDAMERIVEEFRRKGFARIGKRF